jgi:hypothetical protein
MAGLLAEAITRSLISTRVQQNSSPQERVPRLHYPTAFIVKRKETKLLQRVKLDLSY